MRAFPLLTLAATFAVAQSPGPAGFNYDESKVPAYTLPDVLGGAKSKKDWETKRRPELLKLFENQMYGRMEPRLKSTVFETTSVDANALGGKATRKLITTLFAGKKDGPKMEILLYLPKQAKGPAPVFVGLNFTGNHSVNLDEAVPVSTSWFPNNKVPDRGQQSSRWAIDLALERGYAVATVYYGDIDPDFDDGFKNGIHPLFTRTGSGDDFGAIGAWAWGLSRILDYLETDKAVDAKRAIVMGHSRLGKASVWAGATDPRWALVISNDSGAGGVALSKRIFGETVKRLNTSFPHWFCANFRQYNDVEEKLPFDQHELVALIAPRPVYIASAQEDLWADPKGEFLGGLHANPVYKLYGKEGMPASEMPGIHQPVMGTIGYHIRAGKHDVTRYDWEQYLNFADKHLAKK